MKAKHQPKKENNERRVYERKKSYPEVPDFVKNAKKEKGSGKTFSSHMRIHICTI